MNPAKRTLAIVALTTTLVSCSSKAIPASTPPLPSGTLRIYATTATLPLANDLTLAYSETQPFLSFDIRSGNYQTMLSYLLNGETPCFLSTHLPADSPLWAAPLGQDGVAIITHPTNAIANLTTEQLRAIYQGRILNWVDLGGPVEEIVVISREDGADTRAEFDRLVMGRRSTTANARIASSSSSMMDTVASLPGSIGYVSMAYLNSRVHAVSIDSIAPTPSSIVANLYPLRSTIYFVALNEPQDIYRAFVGWIQGVDGQRVVAQHYAPLAQVLPEATQPLYPG